MDSTNQPVQRVIGVDLGKRVSQVCVLEVDGSRREFKVSGLAEAWRRALSKFDGGRVVMEVGGSSPWLSRVLEEMGFEVWVVCATTLKELFKQRRKNDRDDARALALAGQQCPNLLRRVTHVSAAAQRDRMQIQLRDTLVRARTMLIASLRGNLAALGIEFSKGASESVVKRAREDLDGAVLEQVGPMLAAIDSLNAQIRVQDRRIEALAESVYPVTKVLRQVQGVGALTALTFVLKVEDPRRFARNRIVGAYFGLAQGQHQSGDRDVQMSITKWGDDLMRKLLVQAGHYILGPFGPDTDLKRFGLAIAARGGPRAKRRAIVAVARRLAVLLLSLWKSGEVYEPLRNATRCASDLPAMQAV